MIRIPGNILLLAIALALAANVARAQPTLLSERCRLSADEKLPALEAKRRALEQAVLKAAQDERRADREQLLELLYKIDCLKNVPASEPAVTARGARGLAPAAPPTAPPTALEVTAYYATNRTPSGSGAAERFYGSGIEQGSKFTYGRARVTIPPTHTPGNLELPSLWKLERSADPNRHFVLKSVEPLGANAARREMSEKLQGMASQSLLVFVHGYNTSFFDAALRTAQLAHDLEFPGMAFFYSWPSAGKALGYWQDEEASEISYGVFDQLLGELQQLPVKDIYIVAHSMGNRIVANTLANRVDKNEETKRVRALLLAAPDINAEIFRTQIAPKLAAMQGTQTTIYAASSDLALKASKIVHGFKRVGETVGGVFTYRGLDTIDASNAAMMTRDFGHSYLMDSSSVLKDIKAIILQKLAAKQRGLPEAGTAPDRYWVLQ